MLRTIILSILLIFTILNCKTKTPEKADFTGRLTNLQNEDKQHTDFESQLIKGLALAKKFDRKQQYLLGIDTLNYSINITKDSLQNDSLLAFAYHQLGILYFRSKQDIPAITSWEEAVHIRKQIFKADHLELIKVYRNLGNSYFNVGKWKKAKKLFQQSIQLNQSRNSTDSITLAKTYNDLGNTHVFLGELEEAEKYLQVAEQYYIRFFSEEYWILAYVYENLFDFYNAKGNFPMMIKTQNKILTLYKNIESPDDDYPVIANSHNNLGMTFELMDSLDRALRYFKQSKIINERYVQDNNNALGKNYNNIALTYKKQKKYHSALLAIEKAISINKTLKNNLSLADNLDNKAKILLDMKRFGESLQTINQAIDYMCFKGDCSIAYDKPTLVTLLKDKVIILEQLAISTNKTSYLIDANTTNQQLIRLLNQMRKDYQSDASKKFLGEKSKASFEKAIEIALLLFETTKEENYLATAFDWVAQSKSMILLEALTEMETHKREQVNPLLLKRLSQLKNSIAQNEKELFQNNHNNRALQERWLTLSLEAEKLEDSLQLSSSYPYQMDQKTGLTTIEQLKKTIKGSYIEYFIGEKFLYTFILEGANTKLKYIKTELDFPLNIYVQQLRKSMYLPLQQTQQLDQQHADDFVNMAHLLHEKLITPIKNNSNLDLHLTIIPDGILGYLPFEVLIEKKPTQSTYYGSHTYLIHQHQINYNYSSLLLLEMSNKQTKAPQHQMIAFAPSFEAPEETLAYANQRSELVPLKHNLSEIKMIEQLIGGQTFAGVEASKNNFLLHAPNYSIIHLATHGKANNQKGDYSYLAFSNQENDKLYNRELYTVPLNAEMVVLSACETGIGELQKGEGIISLARGFSYAGAKSIIPTLWSVNDKRTKVIMNSFYQNLKEGQEKDQALRTAKLAFISDNKNNALPYFWAAFIAVGDMEAISFGSRNTSIYYWGVGLGICLLVGIGYLFRRPL